MTQLAISVRDLTFAYPPWTPSQPASKVFENLALSLSSGEERLIMGRSGSGKSTLFYLLMGLAPTYTGGTLTGEIWVDGQAVQIERPSPRSVGMLFQDAAAQLFNNSVEYEIAWGLEMLAVPPEQIERKVKQALRKFGLWDVRRRPPWALSGGQQKRLALAALWAQHPNIWLLDEPLVGLDPEGQREVLRSLQELQQTSATLLVTAAHLDKSLPFTSSSLLEEGRLSEAIDLTAIPEQRQFEAGLHPPPEARRAFIESQSKIKPSYALELHHLRFAYPNGPEVLHDLDLAVPQGQCIALVGPNGAGKSTLVRHFNGLLRPTSGSVHVMGKATEPRAIGQLARDVSFLFQRPERQLFAKTVREEIAYGPQQLGLHHVEARVAHSLSHFDLAAVADHPPALLSYGAQRTVTLAALAALDTPILVLDEPLVGLDGQGRGQLFRWLAERRIAGVTLVIVTHDMELARHTDRAIALQAGHIIADGPPDTVLSQLSWERPTGEMTS